MNLEFKKSLLEMVILLIVSNKKISGYQLTQNIYDILSLKEGISYPVIRKLTNEKLLQVYEEKDEKRYYFITEDGIIVLKKLINQYMFITNEIKQLMKGFEMNE